MTPRLWLATYRVRFWAWLRRLAVRYLELPNIKFIGRCSYCGLTIYSHCDYMLVVRTGWKPKAHGGERIALACIPCGARRRTLKRTIKLKEI